MTTIIGIAGSTRQRSYNRALLRAAARLAPEGVTVEEHGIAGIPLYDGDLEEESGVPPAVNALKDRIAAGDGLLLVSPEYNNSVPGPLKNAVDWLSRPPADIRRVFRGKPVVVIGATPGSGGTRLAQTAWLPVLRTLGMRPWFDQALYLGGAQAAFDADLELVDPDLRDRLARLIAGFAAWAGQQRSG